MLHIRMTAWKQYVTGALAAVLVVALVAGGMNGGTAAAATPDPAIKEAQTIIAKFAIPVGPLDGLNGVNTAQGYCAFRWVAGLPVNRARLDAQTQAVLQDYNARYATSSDPYANLHSLPRRYLPNGTGTYIVVNKTCQTMFYFYNGVLWTVFPVSTGRAGQETPSGTYGLKAAVKGWSCSTIYTTTCHTQTAGKYLAWSNYGNMYNKRNFLAGGFHVHGSNTVPTYPDSAGCIRVSVPAMDWITDYVPVGATLVVEGQYDYLHY